MIGLLRKDLYMTAAYCRTFLLILAVFLCVGFVNEENSFFVIYPMIIGMMLPVSILSYDERFKWNLACDAAVENAISGLNRNDSDPIIRVYLDGKQLSDAVTKYQRRNSRAYG